MQFPPPHMHPTFEWAWPKFGPPAQHVQQAAFSCLQGGGRGGLRRNTQLLIYRPHLAYLTKWKITFSRCGLTKRLFQGEWSIGFSAFRKQRAGSFRHTPSLGHNFCNIFFCLGRCTNLTDSCPWLIPKHYGECAFRPCRRVSKPSVSFFFAFVEWCSARCTFQGWSLFATNVLCDIDYFLSAVYLDFVHS